MIKMKMDASFSYFLKEVQIMQQWKKSMLEVQSWGTGPQAEKTRAASGQRPGRKDRCQACRCGRHRRRPCRSGCRCNRGKGEKRRQISFFPKEGQENFLSLFYFSLFYTMRWYICATWANFSVPAKQSSILFIPAFRFCPPDAWQRCGQTPPHIPPGPRPHGAPGHIPTGYCQW